MPKLPIRVDNPVPTLLRRRLTLFETRLVPLLAPVPAQFMSDSRASGVSGKLGNLGSADCLPCSDYQELVQAWRHALKWTYGLDCALSAMLCSVLTTNLIGEQLWFEIQSAASSGKTTLLEGISMNKRYVLSKDTIRGFYAGWKDASGEDASLIAEAAGKTLAMKEGDAFIKSPNVQQILSEGRGIYDRVGRNHYRNKVANEYEGVRMTWIICGTAAIREEIDSSELGARFLACQIMDGIDPDFEDDVVRRSVYQEYRNMQVESNGKPAGQHSPEQYYAMQLTGGYVGYLRENAADLISQVVAEEEDLFHCGTLGKFIAYMRARPSKKDEKQEREFGPRLSKQMVRLAIGLAAVTGTTVKGVMNRVHKIALDTADGPTLKLVEHLHKLKLGGEVEGLAHLINRTPDRTRTLLRFLRQIGVVQNGVDDKGKPTTRRWVLTPRLAKLYEEVKGTHA